MNKLDNIFDINKIRETQETAALFGELAANGIHVIAEKNGWKEGSPEKTALHAAVGAVIADITNGNIAAGAITGGTTEYLTKAILKASKGDKAQAQWIALAVGAALSKATGGNEQLGAFIAVNAVRNNELFTKEEIAEMLKDNNWGEELCKMQGKEATPENIAGIENSLLGYVDANGSLKVDAYMVYAEGEVTGSIGFGGGLLYDEKGNSYITVDGSKSKGMLPGLSGEVCALTVVPLDNTVKLTDEALIEILTGESVGFTGYIGAGGGLSTPINGKYAGKVLILKRGFGTPQIGIGGGITEIVDNNVVEAIIERKKEGLIIED